MPLCLIIESFFKLYKVSVCKSKIVLTEIDSSFTACLNFYNIIEHAFVSFQRMSNESKTILVT